jgi:tRNA/tmRNA/rRNA uracil-C5-methylase (TrmA/RlmC/RlmD family)
MVVPELDVLVNNTDNEDVFSAYHRYQSGNYCFRFQVGSTQSKSNTHFTQPGEEINRKMVSTLTMQAVYKYDFRVRLQRL